MADGIGAVHQDIIGHLTGFVADVIVADGQRGHAAALADALLTGDDGSAGVQGDVADQFGVVGSGVVGGNVQDIAGRAG